MISEELKSELKKANGKRRVRLLTEAEVENCIRYAAQYGHHLKSGGSVANAYMKKVFFPPDRTACFAALRSDGRIAVCIGTSTATKTASEMPKEAHFTLKVTNESAINWADRWSGTIVESPIKYTTDGSSLFKEVSNGV